MEAAISLIFFTAWHIFLSEIDGISRFVLLLLYIASIGIKKSFRKCRCVNLSYISLLLTEILNVSLDKISQPAVKNAYSLLHVRS